MKIVFLYSEMMGYNYVCFKKLVEQYNCEVYVIKWDKKQLPYVPPEHPNIYYYNRSDFDNKSLLEFCKKISPDLIYISGWMDKGYVNTVRKFRNYKNIPVLCACDTWWERKWRQKVGAFFARFFIKRFFTHFFVAGIQQYEYARRLGYGFDNIITHLYSCDTEYFNAVYDKYKESKSKTYPKKIIYVGRFVEVKRLDILMHAFNEVTLETNHEWTLELYGNGPLLGELSNIVANNDKVKFFDYVKPEELDRVYGNGGFFCLPSRRDNWSAVVHESVSSGVPVLASSRVGATTFYVHNNYNGFIFDTGNKADMKKCLLKLFKLNDQELLSMSERSYLLSKAITPEIWAAKVTSVIEKYNS